jgi:hypothetical protein
MNQVEREMSITVWNTWQGWMASVGYLGRDDKILKPQEDPFAALDRAMKLYDEIINEQTEDDDADE